VKPLAIVPDGAAKNKRLMRENGSCRKVIYMGDIQGPEKVNDICLKTMHAGMMARGFTVHCFRRNLNAVTWSVCVYYVAYPSQSF
jgi:hypothetical protein